MTRRIYVGNIPYSVVEDELRSVFEGESREIEDVHIPFDHEAGRPRGFAFIEFASDAQAEEAIQAFNGFQLHGRTLNVNEAKPRAPRGAAQHSEVHHVG